MSVNSRYMLPTNYGMTQWKQLFNPRQQLALVTFLDRIKACYDPISNDCASLTGQVDMDVDTEALGKAVVGYLSIIMGRICSIWVISNADGSPLQRQFASCLVARLFRWCGITVR